MKEHDDSYLDSINDPMDGSEDKHELSKYLVSSKKHKILEIGPGAGSVLKKLILMSKSWHNEDHYHVIDFDRTILKVLKEDKFLHEWPYLYPVQANAIHLPYKNAYFDLINLSAVAHEISSYAGGFLGLKLLAEECSRVLANDGVLIFRELEGVDLKQITECNIVTPPAVAFFHLFYRRFIDQQYTSIDKPAYYDQTKIDIRVFNNNKCSEFSFEILAPDSIIQVQAQAGFIREIQRHFITFVDTFAPEYFHEIKNSIDSDDCIVVFAKKSSVKGFLNFVKVYNIDYYRIDENSYQISKTENDLFENFINNKFINLLTSRCEVIDNNLLRKYLLKENISFDRNDGNLLLSLGAAIYLQNIIELEGLPISKIDDAILKWAKREADEHYFFGNFSDMLVFFIENSVRVDFPHSGVRSGFTCLVPISTKYVPRKKYVDILQKCFIPINGHTDSAILEGKRIVHFKKMPIEHAINQISNFLYCNDTVISIDQLLPLIKKLESYVRDFFCRSLNFNKKMKTVVTEIDSFLSDTLLLEDEIVNISKSEDIVNNIGKNFLLVGRLATKKESFQLFFEEQGYMITNLTDLLAGHLDNSMPSRKDLYDTSKILKEKYGPEYLAKLAVDIINQNSTLKHLVLGCRSAQEIKYIKENFPDIVILGLFPDKNTLLKRLKKRYPKVNDEAFFKWIAWDDSREMDHHANIKMCMQLCDILFCGVDNKIVSKNDIQR